MSLLGDVAKSLGSTLSDFATTTAYQAIQGQMGHNANTVSAQGQANAMNFNQTSANAANAQNLESMMNQYQFNSSQAAMANDFTANMWQRTADWNEAMWEKQAAFNAEQAEIQRQWQEKMASTQYQRAINDMSKAGLNPILAVTGGGVGTSVPGGATASVGGSMMSSAQGQMASGGLLGANSAAVGGYQGQMEYTGNVLNLLATALGGYSTAAEALGALGDAGEEFAKEANDVLTVTPEKAAKALDDFGNDTKYDNQLYRALANMSGGVGSGLVAIHDLAKTGLPQKVITALNDFANKKFNHYTGKSESAINITKAMDIIKEFNVVPLITNYHPKG